MTPSKGPKPPNPQQLSSEQTHANVAAAKTQQQLNQTNQAGPLGSNTYTTDPKTGQSTLTTSLSPAEQGLLSGSQATGGAANTQALADVGGIKPLDLSNTSVMSDIASVYQPQFQQQQQWAQEQLNSQLANQGIFPGSEAYDRSQQTFQTSQGDAWNNILENARAQSVNEMEAQFQLPAAQATQLAGLGQPQMPQLQSTPQTGVQPTNVSGITQQSYQDQLARQQLQQQQQNAMMGGLFGLGGAALQAGGTYAGNAALGAALA